LKGAIVNAEELKLRTKKFALRIIVLVRSLPNNPEGWVIGKQILRCGTSVGANYRAACRARSDAEFSSKIGIVLEEADETVFWLELLQEGEILPPSRVEKLKREAEELVRVFASSRITVEKRNRRSNLKSEI
jgi:four helix bundle protein